MTNTQVFVGSLVLLTGVGAEGQVGEVVARAFAEQGASVLLVDRTADNVAARAAALTKLGFSAHGYACDLTDEAAVSRLVAEIRQQHGTGLNGLVHMAGGFGMSGPVAESALDVWNKQLAINLTTAYLTTRAFLPLLRASRGAIVLFASEAALPGKVGANRSAYAVAKTGVVTLMQSIASEEQGNGVRANAVAPTSIRTAANIAAMGDGVRYIEREEVAAVVTYLCSSASSAINGALIPLT